MAQTTRSRYRPKRRSLLWRAVKRYQLIELFLIVGGIVLAWLGTAVANAQL